MGQLVLVKGEWDHRDITSNVIAYKHLLYLPHHLITE